MARHKLDRWLKENLPFHKSSSRPVGIRGAGTEVNTQVCCSYCIGRLEFELRWSNWSQNAVKVPTCSSTFRRLCVNDLVCEPPVQISTSVRSWGSIPVDVKRDRIMRIKQLMKQRGEKKQLRSFNPIALLTAEWRFPQRVLYPGRRRMRLDGKGELFYFRLWKRFIVTNNFSFQHTNSVVHFERISRNLGGQSVF